jgi:hypothetical protein
VRSGKTTIRLVLAGIIASVVVAMVMIFLVGTPQTQHGQIPPYAPADASK